MSENDNQQPLTTVFCKNGCGFYGSSQSDGLCSICFKEALRQKQGGDAVVASSQLTADVVMCSSASASSLPADASSLEASAAAAAAGASSDSGAVASKTFSSGLLPPPCVEDCNSVNSSDASATESQSGDGQQSRRGRNRCDACRKKVGLTGFECRCGGNYCSVHRYSDKHNCQFDYQTHGQAEIRKANPQVVKNKVDKL